MRLTKIKLAGFKSFVDPTHVSFPSNLTGIVGPNGCGKSNVIDAVRWVMGELSAKHLRGDSMADVIFNGSSGAQARRRRLRRAGVRQLGRQDRRRLRRATTKSSLKRLVSRDGSSSYFINGARCRRKDITQLFLGTGLGSRSYAIIEQGMISRVIESKPDDMRAFVEEAAGISKYKERRNETESRVAETRENLERLQDVRDEIDKQIRHLQRQAATARRYQALKEQERKLTAEVLALRLRELDSGAEVHDSAMRERDLAMQAALADQRSAEAAIEKQRAFHTEQSEQRRRGAGPLLRGRRGDLAHRADHPAHPRAARAAEARSGAGARHAQRSRPAHRAGRAQLAEPARGDRRARARSSRASQLAERAARRQRSRPPSRPCRPGSRVGRLQPRSSAPRTRPRRWSGRASSSSRISCAG